MKKNNKIYYLVFILIILVTLSADIPFLFKAYVQNKYPMTQITNEQFLGKSENLKDFKNNNGRLHSLSSYPWVLYNSNEVNFDQVTQIKLNVKYLSTDTATSEIYVRDLDHCIRFEIKEGENIINIPSNINEGQPIKGFRFNLINKDDTEIEIDNIVFNDTDSIIKNIFVKQYEEQITKVLLLLILCVTPILLFKLGLKKSRLNKLGYKACLYNLIGMAVLYKFNAINNIFYFVFMGISALLAAILIYYFITKIFLSIYDEFYTKIKINEQIFLTITFFICCFIIYLNIKILFIYIAFYPFYLFGFIYDKFKIVQSKNIFSSKIIMTVSIFILLKFIFNINDMTMLWNNFDTSNIKLSIIVMIIMTWFIGFSILQIEWIRGKIKLINISKIKDFYLLSVIFIFSMILNAEIYGFIYLLIFIVLSLFSLKNIYLIYSEYDGNNSQEKESVNYLYLDKKIKSLFTTLCIIVATTLFFESFIEYYLNKGDISIFISNYIFTPKCLYNLILLTIVFYLVVFLFGNSLGKCILSIVGVVLLVGNYIKIRYQNTLLKPADFMQIKSLIEISKNFVSIYIILSLVLIIIIVSIFIVKFRRNIISVLKPSPNIVMIILTGMCFIFFVFCLEQGKFKDVEISKEIEWLGDKVRIEKEGFFIYNYFNIKSIDQMKIEKPNNYNKETMDKLKSKFQTLQNNNDNNINDVKPNVILIMEESMFDIQKVNGMEFSKTIDSNIKQYQKGTIISPRYGGGTASVEFEALTGCSNIFFPDNIIEYVTYWNKNDNIPSIAKEFNKNGYTTTAIHPNDANFYNRNEIYTAMGFNKFLSINDFKGHTARSTRGFVLDSEVKDVIDQQLNATDDPQFIFAVTIENHGLYNSKDAGNDIKISSDKLSDSETYESESYSGGLADADDFVGKVIESVKNSDKPTIVYIWGDHLPALSALDKLGFLKDVYNTYSTPLVAYSNFSNINVGSDYMTPNQLAPQVLKDSGISYNSYFDYIYSLRKDYPIVHKEFNVNMDDESIKDYQLLQYDLLFGDKYILN